MKKCFSLTCLMLVLGVLLLPAPGRCCWWWGPNDLVPDDSCSGGEKRILITYDSRHNATSLIAQSIYNRLCENASVDLKYVNNLDPDDIETYDAIIIGSPIYISSWLPDVNRLLQLHHDKIARVPSSAYFITCTFLKDSNDTPQRRQDAYDYYIKKVVEQYPDIKPIDTGVLSGEFLYSELYFLEWFLMKISGFQEGDFRNEAKIEAWADGFWEKIQ